MKLYLLIQRATDVSPQVVYRIREFDSVATAYGTWIKEGCNGYIAKIIEPKVVEV